jgi:hypothetical protein
MQRLLQRSKRYLGISRETGDTDQCQEYTVPWAMDVDISSEEFAWELEIAMIISELMPLEKSIDNNDLSPDDHLV